MAANTAFDPSMYEEIGASTPATGAPSASAPQPARASPAPLPQMQAPQAATATAQQASAPAPTSGTNAFDPSQYDELPAHADGSSPQFPINQSPVSIGDRFKLALGNEKGSLDYLKKNFQDATKDSEGNLVVKQGSTWYRVSPKGLGDTDPWSSTKDVLHNLSTMGKEALGSSAAAAPTLAKIGVSIVGDIGGAVAGTLAAPGAGTVAGGIAGGAAAAGAAEGLRTSLGRLVGTYNTDDQSQVKDIALESLLTLGGGVIGAGVKPGASWAAKQIGPIGEKLAIMSNASKDMVAKLLGTTSGVGENNVWRMWDRPQQLSAELKGAVASGADAAEELQRRSIDHFGDMVQKVQPALSKMYRSMTQQVAEQVPADFNGSVRSIADKVYEGAEKLGLGSVGDDGIFALHTDKQLGAKASEFLESTDPLQQQQGQMLQSLIGNPKARNIVQQALDTMEAKATALGDSSGKAGAIKLMGFKQAMNGAIDQLTDEAVNNSAHTARLYLQMLNGHLENQMLQKFEQRGVDGAITNGYEQIAKSYAQAKAQVQPLLNIAAQARNPNVGEVAYERGLNQMLSATGKNLTKKSAFDSGVDFVASQGDNSILALKDKILDQQAAKSFIPVLNQKGIAKLTTAGAAGAAAVMHNPASVIGAGALAAGTSPRLTGAAVSTSSATVGATKSLIDAGFKGLDFLRQANATKQLPNLLTNDDMLRNFFQSVVQAPQLHDAVSQHLQQQIKGAAAPIAFPQQLPEAK